MTYRLFLLAPFALAACHARSGAASSGPAASADQADIATAATRDYMTRFSQDVCVDPVTVGRAGAEAIPHDLVNRTVTWTYLIRNARGGYRPVDAGLAATLNEAWAGVHSGGYPGVTLPGDALPLRKEPCARTLTLTSPIVAGDIGFVRWSDGTSRRTMALRKGKTGWAVIAEGPARIG